MEKRDNDLEFVLQNAFDDLIKRRNLMLLWNINQPTEGETLSEIWSRFISTVLFEPSCIELTHKSLLLFGHSYHRLCIPFGVLDGEGRAALERVYMKRKQLFKNEEGNRCFNCVYKVPILTYWRRGLVKEFCIFVLFKLKEQGKSSLLRALLDHINSGDPFVPQLYYGVLNGMITQTLLWDNSAADEIWKDDKLIENGQYVWV